MSGLEEKMNTNTIGGLDILVVHKESLYSFYKNSKDGLVREYALHEPGMRENHEQHEASLETVLESLAAHDFAYESISRNELAAHNPPPDEYDLVVAVGGDGTILDVAHYLSGDTPILGVNSTPKPGGSVGYYCFCSADDFCEVLENLDAQPRTRVYRLDMALDGKPLPPAMNDILVCHKNPGAMTRYDLVNEDKKIDCKDSGLLVSTPVGSTAFMWNEGGEAVPVHEKTFRYHQRSFRDAGFYRGEKITIRSKTREGVVLIDGEHAEFPFSVGQVLNITMGKPITLIGDLQKKQDEFIAEYKSKLQSINRKSKA